ncbi:MAG: alpha/beta hydrolase [Oscillospiraceae bacterium]|jgi:pimeloyl-ACP methyl ester carboxylesterase|nr:alpha/beta hydrolase [Oscillospiraceae bacterium]
MTTQNIKINNIPSIIWGKQSDQVYIHVHGKMSRKEYAEPFAQIAEKKSYQTLSFDLPEHGERSNSDYRCDIWNGMNDLSLIADYAFSKWNDVSLFACSLGAYFSLNTYANRKFSKCLFQSPMLNMEYMIRQMFKLYDVSEERLRLEKEISTPFDTLRWDYFQYVLEHPIKNWNIPTSILYGGKDNLQPIKIIQAFADEHHCKLTVSENSEHPFMQPEDVKIVAKWFEDNL